MEKRTPLKTRVEEYEYLDDETMENIKYRVSEKQQITIYLAPFGKWFTPCEEDQEKLNHILENCDPLEVLYSNASIKLQREYVRLDETEKEIERRPPTKEDFKREFSWNHWEKAWDEYQESLK